MQDFHPIRSFSRNAGFVLGFFAALAFFSAAQADDKELLGRRARPPYVFILFDTSGSMTWNVGETELPFLRSDSPDSKIYQAKQALYQVVSDLSGVNFGFASFNQDDMRVTRKHWLYQARTNGIKLFPSSPSSTLYAPMQGEAHAFGATHTCTTGSQIGCNTSNPADVGDSWEYIRTRMLSKLGTTGTSAVSYFLRAPNPSGGTRTFTVTFDDTGTAVVYGSPTISVRVSVSASGIGAVAPPQTVLFDLVPGGEAGFVSNDLGASRTSRVGYFDFADILNDNTCAGWEGNDDDSSDDYEGTNLKVPTDNSDTSLAVERRYGDVIPLNWDDDNRDQVLARLAPNRLLEDPEDEDFEPDFRVAPYLENTPISGEIHLVDDLEDADGTVLMPEGLTPLGGSLADFRTWYDSWRELAANGEEDDRDDEFGCRNTYVLLLTDGLETCSGNGQAQAAALLDAGIKTFVVGFGVTESAGDDDLDEIAAAGGTGTPFRPQSVEQLVEDLKNVFNEIQSQTAAFASAAVPSVQTNVADKVFLTSFTAVADGSKWDGHIDAFLKPVPLKADLTPDRDRVCGANDRAACLAWDAGVELVEQSLTAAELAEAATAGDPDDPVGEGPEQRRVFFAPAAPSTVVPETRAFLWADADSTNAEWRDLLFNFGISTGATPTAAQKSQGQAILANTYKINDVTIPIINPDGTTSTKRLVYVLGDIFHSDPLVVSNPNNFSLFSVDHRGNGKACNDGTEPNPGYRCYFEKHLYRRKMLFVGSNDGQFHAIDAGILRERISGSRVLREFDNGTGREIFSLVPRAATARLRELSDTPRHKYSVDGPSITADVFVDPAHAGTPTATEREWRSIVIGSMREGGRSLFALDVTQPDLLGEGIDPDNNLENIPTALDSGNSTADYVPSCWDGGAECGPTPFAAKLWEFTDVADADGNSLPDLGDTWSTPVVGLVKVQVGSAIEERWVAVFGGGMDPEFQQEDPADTSSEDWQEDVQVVGNWLYMVDVETGQAIYKRRVDGAIPTQVAAVDANRDLYLDTVYFGTTSGILYKVDLSGSPPPLEDLTNPPDDEDPLWEPFPVFTTGGRAIFYPPAVINVASQGLFALAFGTGYREDLWRDPTGEAAQYYILLDQDFTETTSGLPLTTSALAFVDVDDPSGTTDNLLEGGGWFMTLRPGERVISRTFALAGVTIFTTYTPDIPNPSSSEDGLRFCSATGQSRAYILFTTNANAVRRDPTSTDNEKTRYLPIAGFVTSPFLELTGTKNEVTSDPSNPDAPRRRITRPTSSTKSSSRS